MQSWIGSERSAQRGWNAHSAPHRVHQREGREREDHARRQSGGVPRAASAAAACSRSTWIRRASSARCSASTSTARGARRSICCSTACSATPASTARPVGEPGRNPASLLPITRTRIPQLDVVLANKSLALFPSWDGSEDADPTGRLRAHARRGARARRLRLRLLRRAALLRPAHAVRAARGARDRAAGAAHLPRARRLRRAAAHGGDGAHPLRQSGAAHLDGRADLLSPHAARARDPREAEAALPEGDRAHGGRLPRAHRRGAVARALDLRARADGPRRARDGGARRGARAARRGRRARRRRSERRRSRSRRTTRRSAGIARARVGGSRRSGRDPFAEVVEIDPFLERLDAHAHARPRRGARGRAEPRPRASAGRCASRARLGRRRPAQWTTIALPRRRRARTPALGEIELPEPRGWLDRLLGEDERRRARRARAPGRGRDALRPLRLLAR